MGLLVIPWLICGVITLIKTFPGIIEDVVRDFGFRDTPKSGDGFETIFYLIKVIFGICWIAFMAWFVLMLGPIFLAFYYFESKNDEKNK